MKFLGNREIGEVEGKVEEELVTWVYAGPEVWLEVGLSVGLNV